ncbi:MAG TPA: M3 family metallopeptidase [Kofleriaceae bacterium]|nr:M3 family metallopeptidase [Kofleriaceae bacterium]
MAHRLFLVLTTGLLAACSGGSSSKTEATRPQPPPEVPVAPAPPRVDPAVLAHRGARAEVNRLIAEADKNPLLAAWTGPYGGVPPWDRVKHDAFPAAFQLGLAVRAAEIVAITSDPAAPTFANTIAAMQDAGRHIRRAETLFSVMQTSLNGPEVQAVSKEWAPKLAAADDEITFDEKLFARIAAVHAAREAPGEQALSAEQRRLVERTYDRFVRTGAKLTAAQKQQLGAINQELAGLFTEFANKVLADENTWIVVDRAADLDGLPDSMKAAYQAAAAERKLPAAKSPKGEASRFAIVNTRSSVDPVLTSASVRSLREKVWKAFKRRGDNGNANDTNATIARIVKLRAERAALLGYPSHAHWRMADTMAVDPAKAQGLMMRVWPAAAARVREEVADMMKIAKRDRVKTFEPWDYLYYAEKVRKAKYNLDQAELKPYFELDNMIAASFYMAEQLYGLTFHEITGKVPVFHPDVRVWEVKRKDGGAYVGLFYGDNFARAGKRSGAWASSYQGHETFTGTHRRPITSNNNNFVKGAPGEPVLISLDDAETLFHEFGHALHSLLSEVSYPGLAVTPRDFVEYPSQVHEQWVLSRPILDRFAKHYKTGQPMPQALVDKINASSKFNQGYHTVEYLTSAILDMEMHTRPDGKIDAKAFERDMLAKIGAPKEVALRHRLPQFLHLFASDSYSAGYYSYLWSEVMDADTREAFAEAGDLFHKPTADKMRKYILAPGNSTDRSEAYRQFRGRDPDVKALLKKRGFPIAK